MKTIATLLGCGGVLMASWAIAPSPSKRAATPVVTLGPIEAPLPTPRVRVSNDQPVSVDVWYVRVGDAKTARRLGWVSGSATRTFLLPEDAGTIRLVVAPRGVGEPFVTGGIEVGPETDIGVELTPKLETSGLEVREMKVSRVAMSR
jgi:hypothetical protein